VRDVFSVEVHPTQGTDVRGLQRSRLGTRQDLLLVQLWLEQETTLLRRFTHQVGHSTGRGRHKKQGLYRSSVWTRCVQGEAPERASVVWLQIHQVPTVLRWKSHSRRDTPDETTVQMPSNRLVIQISYPRVLARDNSHSPTQRLSFSKHSFSCPLESRRFHTDSIWMSALLSFQL